MKKLFVVIAVFSSSFTISQQYSNEKPYTFTKADARHADSLRKNGINWNSVAAEFLVLLNQYRVKNGLNELIWNDSALNASEFMSDYCLNNKIITHDTNIDGFETFTDRCNKFKLDYENSKCLAGECGLYTPLFIMYIKQQKSIAEYILGCWIESKNHNSILLTKDAKFAGMYSKNNGGTTPIYAFLVVF